MSAELKIEKSPGIAFILILVVAVAAFAFANRSDTLTSSVIEIQYGMREGQLAIPFEFTDIDNNVLSLDSFKGKPTLLAFMATWCIPCQIEARNARTAQNSHEFNVIQLDIDQKETNAQLQTFKTNFGKEDWVMAKDVGQRIANQYQVRSFDTTLLLDSEGAIVFRDEGSPVSSEELNGLLNRMT